MKRMFGIEMRRPENKRLREIISETVAETYDADGEELRAEAKRQIIKAQEEQRRTFNKRKKESRTYCIGDVVAIKRS